MKRTLFLVFAFLGVDAMETEPAFFPEARFESEIVSPLMGRNNNNAEVRQINGALLAVEPSVYAYVNATNEVGETVLHIAAQSGQDEAYELLCKNGADETIRRNDGKTPPECRPEECSLCLELLIDGLGKSNQCQHIFHKACINEWLKRSSKCPMRCKNAIVSIEDCAPVSGSNKSMTALMQAVHAGNLLEVTRLIEQSKPKKGIQGFIERVKKHPVYATALFAATLVSLLGGDVNFPDVEVIGL